jgi:DNA-binding LytR/AlgR family response regulator
MTDAGDSTRAAAGRRDRRFLLVVAVIGIAVGLVDALSVAHDRAAAGLPLPLWEPLVWEASSVAVLVALSPALMALARRVTPFEAPWPQVVLSQVAGALAFSLVHVAAMGVLRWAAYAAVGDDYPVLKPLLDFPYELRKDLLTYAAILAAYVGWLRLFPAAGSAGGEFTIEVRDGSHRHFVTLTDILWIEAAGNYVELHRGASPLLHRASLSEMEQRLRDANFVRIHRSRLVRRDAVAEVESKPSGDYVVRLEDGRELAGSRRYRRPLLEP